MLSVQHILFPTILIQHEVRNKSFFLWERVGQRGWSYHFHWTAEDELFIGVSFTPCMLFCCLFVTNKMTIVAVLSHKTRLTAHYSHTLKCSLTQRKWNPKLSPSVTLFLPVHHCHFQGDTGKLILGFRRKFNLSNKTSSQSFYPENVVNRDILLE